MLNAKLLPAHKCIWMLIMSVALNGAASSATTPYPGKKQKFHGYNMYVDGGNRIVIPHKTADGRPWVWRARFFGHEPQFDLAMLKQGWHVVYCDVGGLFGSDQAVKRWNDYYRFLKEKLELADRAILEGFSRGGLIIYRWGAANPGKVAAIYGDAPVMDFKSWPRKKSPGDWKRCLEVYGLTEKEALAFKENPVDTLAPLAQAKIPIIHVVGDADAVVPVIENTAVAEKRYLQLGGTFKVIHKPGIGHHPHSLKDPAPIVDFILKHRKADSELSATSTGISKNVHLRGNYRNSRIQFERKKKGHVAFIGGSITFMDGYRPMLCRMLEKRFPETDFTFTAAGVSSTCSTTGACRLTRDVLLKGPVDLFFIEFAVNDDQDAHHNCKECIRGMEGIIVQTRRHNPCADIVITNFVNPEMIEKLAADQKPVSNTAHHDVARHYTISLNDLAQEVTDRIQKGTLTWKKFGGVHPSRYGNSICAAMISDALLKQWKKPLPADAEKKSHPLPDLMDEFSYTRGRLLKHETVQIDKNWTIGVPEWEKRHGHVRNEFRDVPLVYSEKAGAKLKVPFTGTAIGAYMLAGADSALLKVRVDGGTAKVIETLHYYSSFQYPRSIMFFDELANGEHVLELEILPNRPGRLEGKKGGTAFRAVAFIAN